MARVVMYATRFCPYCVRARMLLDSKGIDFAELAVDRDPHLRREMQEKSRRSSVPQIFIDELHVGGFMELWALEQSGELDELLGLDGQGGSPGPGR